MWVRDEFMPAMNERVRQVDEEHFTLERDDQINGHGELAQAAAAYAMPGHLILDKALLPAPVMEVGIHPNMFWPQGWDKSWFKPNYTREGRLRDIDKAMALLAAERGRLVRKLHEP